MPLMIEDFKNYTDYPMGLCKGYSQGSEKENMLAFILSKAIEAKDIYIEVETKHTHPTMVADGLLNEIEPYKYKLTDKSLSMIYAHQKERQ